eukprot:255197-Chlamydomonas_euryale.AAC.2
MQMSCWLACVHTPPYTHPTSLRTRSADSPCSVDSACATASASSAARLRADSASAASAPGAS